MEIKKLDIPTLSHRPKTETLPEKSFQQIWDTQFETIHKSNSSFYARYFSLDTGSLDLAYFEVFLLFNVFSCNCQMTRLFCDGFSIFWYKVIILWRLIYFIINWWNIYSQTCRKAFAQAFFCFLWNPGAKSVLKITPRNENVGKMHFWQFLTPENLFLGTCCY